VLWIERVATLTMLTSSSCMKVADSTIANATQRRVLSVAAVGDGPAARVLVTWRSLPLGCDTSVREAADAQ